MSICFFKRKISPECEILNHKALLYDHDGIKQWVVNFWETYWPLFNWIYVHDILTLISIMDMETKSINLIISYTQAEVKTDIFR